MCTHTRFVCIYVYLHVCFVSKRYIYIQELIKNTDESDEEYSQLSVALEAMQVMYISGYIVHSSVSAKHL